MQFSEINKIVYESLRKNVEFTGSISKRSSKVLKLMFSYDKISRMIKTDELKRNIFRQSRILYIHSDEFESVIRQACSRFNK